MKFTVEMLAFGRPGEVREVEVRSLETYEPRTSAEEIASLVYILGQNDVDPQPHPSVSAGDVINIGEDKWLVLAAGFKKLTPEDYLWYKGLPRDERIMIPFTLKP